MTWAAGWKADRDAAALFFFAAPVARVDAAGARFVAVEGWEAPVTGLGGLKEGPFLRAAFAVGFLGGI
jgi:hypothetical protein